MRLAADPITVELDGVALPLRPTLRAALRLEQRFGFPDLFRAVDQGNVTALSAILAEGSGQPELECRDALCRNGLQVGLAAAAMPILAFLVELTGFDGEQTPEGKDGAAGEAVTMREYLESLFRIGTGWMGWSAARTWKTSPAEIAAAAKGRRELVSSIIKAVFGSSDADDEPADVDLDAKVTAGMLRLGSRGLASKAV